MDQRFKDIECNKSTFSNSQLSASSVPVMALDSEVVLNLDGPCDSRARCVLQDGGNSEGISFLDNYQHSKLRTPLQFLLCPISRHTICQLQFCHLKRRALLSLTS